MRKFDHYVANNVSQEVKLVHVEQKVHKQVIVSEPIATISEDRDQQEAPTRRSHCAIRAPKRFDVLTNSSIF